MLAQLPDGVGRAGDRLAGDVQDAVDVQQNRRHGRESIRVTKTVAIPVSEIELRFSRSSGPGGQHAQKTETRVEALFDVEASAALTPTQKSARRARRPAPFCARSRRTSGASRGTASSRSSGSSARSARRCKVERRRRPTKPTRGVARAAPPARSAAAARRSSSAAAGRRRAGGAIRR